MTRRQPFLILCALAPALLLVPATAHAQHPGAVYLQDGSVLTGQIHELVPGDHVTLQIGGGQPIVIPYGIIARVEIPPQPAPTPEAYRLQAPGVAPSAALAPQAPRRERPGLGLPLLFLAFGVALPTLGGVIIYQSNDGDSDEGWYSTPDMTAPGIVLASAGAVFLGVFVLTLVRRVHRRRSGSREGEAPPLQPQYSVAPILSLGAAHYGLQGRMIF